MVRYLLDSVVISDFQKAGALAALAAASRNVPLLVVEHVHAEMTIAPLNASPSKVGRAREAQRGLESGSFEILQFFPGTPEHALFMQLTRGVARKHGNGEAASIAVAVARQDLVFVTGDVNATLSALNELSGSGERVMRVPVFVRLLSERRALSPRDVRVVAPLAADHGVEPSWWADWLSNLPL